VAVPVKASVTTAMTGAQNDVTLTSKWNAGKTIALTLLDPGGAQSDPSISVDEQTGEIIVVLRRAGSAIATTADELLCLINGSPPGGKADGSVFAIAQHPTASPANRGMRSRDSGPNLRVNRMLELPTQARGHLDGHGLG
jgi:hypothetical protein